MKPEIGIIVPVYNVENYIERCINSIIKQSYTNFILILVDDGSNDNSLNICKKYSSIDKRVKVISQKNKGVSSARNKGIEFCQSEYLCFIDSDDYVESDYLNNFVENLYDDSDLIFQGINKCYKDKIEKIIPQKGIYCRDELLNGISDINKFSIFGYVCTKLYKTEIIKKNKLVFNNNIKISEDRIFALQYLYYCNKLYVVNKSSYNYIIHNTGLTAYNYSYSELKIAADTNLHCAILLFSLPNNERFKADTYRMYIMSSFNYITALFKNKGSFKYRRIEVKKYLTNYSQWIHTFKPQDKYYKFLFKVLKLNNSYFITIILQFFWNIKAIKSYLNNNI